MDDYAADFVRYTRECGDLVSARRQQQEVGATASRFLKALADATKQRTQETLRAIPKEERTVERAQAETVRHLTELVQLQQQHYTGEAVGRLTSVPELLDYPWEDFQREYEDTFREVWDKTMPAVPAPEAIREGGLRVLYHYFQSDDFRWSLYSGIGILGYGDKDLYPGCRMLHFAEMVCGHVRFKEVPEESAQVDDDDPATILPLDGVTHWVPHLGYGTSAELPERCRG